MTFGTINYTMDRKFDTPLVMGILNVTPDSFYDGEKFDVLIEEGADIVDIGGESTGPGSEDVDASTEMERVIPTLTRVKQYASEAVKQSNNEIVISVDTYKYEVAREAIDAGAGMINDVTAGRGDPNMFKLIAERGCTYIIMYSKDDSPRTTIEDVSYDDVLKTIHDYFEERIEKALQAGIKQNQLILDPGLGHFISGDPSYSWHILENLEFLKDFDCPILVSPSRKSFTAESPNQPPSERLPGTLNATKIALEHGADIIRTHDIRETRSLMKSRE